MVILRVRKVRSESSKTYPRLRFIHGSSSIFFLVSELRHGFYIISGKKSFAVYAATATEKSEWMAHIQKCVADLIAKGDR